MPIITEPLRNKRQTIDRMFEVAKKYSSDLDSIYIKKNNSYVSLSRLSLPEFYEVIKNIPYQRDIEPIEIVARPRIVWERFLTGKGKDCKKAAVMLGAYFNKKNIPWRLATVSTRKDRQVHHVFPQADIYLSGQFINVDATYPSMSIGQGKRVTKIEYF